MTVRVTFDFDSHDEALVFLARAASTKVAAAQGKAPLPGPTGAKATGGAQSATPSTSRKPRNDAGKVRGPHNKQSSEGAGAVTPAASDAAGVTPAPEEPAGPSATAMEGESPSGAELAVPADPIPQTAPGQPIPDEKDCQAAMTKVWEFAGKDQIPTCRTLLERFGVKRIGEIGPDLRAEFIAKCESVLKGEAA